MDWAVGCGRHEQSRTRARIFHYYPDVKELFESDPIAVMTTAMRFLNAAARERGN
jgi:hypothetical protein